MMQYVEFLSGANTLRGMLHLPAGERPAAAVLLCHGFTASRMESHFLFVKISRMLEQLDIASLRFDFAGSGESDGEFENITLSSEMADASVALDFLRRHPAVDPGRIGLLGLSMGGAVAAMVTARRPDEVRGLALLSAVADPARIVSFIRTGKYETQLAQWGHLDMNGHKVGRGFLQDVEGKFPAGDLAAYPGPVLVVHGSGDSTVPASEALTYQDARRSGKGPTQLEIIDKADHTYASLTHTQQVLELVKKFFGENL
jgi:hypothetical protein